MTGSRVVLTAAVLLLVSAGHARDGSPGTSGEQPDTMLQLLELIRLESEEGSRLNRERIERFRKARDERQRMLEEVLRELEAEDGHSGVLNWRFEKNERELAELEERLEVRIGNFGELFGVVRDVAGNTVAEVLDSLVSAEYPDRAAVAREMVLTRELPSLEDLRALQLTLLEEMVQSGQVVRFTAAVTDPAGRKTIGEVIRVGTFNLVHDGKFVIRIPVRCKRYRVSRRGAFSPWPRISETRQRVRWAWRLIRPGGSFSRC